MTWFKDSLGNLLVNLFGMSRSIPADHPFYKTLIAALQEGDADKFIKFSNISDAMDRWSCGNFSCKNGTIYFKGREVVPELQKYLTDLFYKSRDPRPFLRFMIKVYDKTNHDGSKVDEKNFVMRVEGLWRWLENQSLHLTEDGNFLAYKYVSIHEGEDFYDVDGNLVVEGDFVDSYTGKTHRYNVGDEPKMSLKGVNRQPEICAGAGLHVGNKGYACYGKNSVIVEVNPKDVIVVPKTEACKIRTVGFKVVDVYERELDTYYYTFSDAGLTELKELSFESLAEEDLEGFTINWE